MQFNVLLQRSPPGSGSAFSDDVKIHPVESFMFSEEIYKSARKRYMRYNNISSASGLVHSETFTVHLQGPFFRVGIDPRNFFFSDKAAKHTGTITEIRAMFLLTIPQW